MNSKTRGNGPFQGMGWVVVSVSMLLIISAALELFAQQALERASLATVVLALFLAFWSYILGVACLLFVSVRWLVGWRRVHVTRAAMSRYAPAVPRSKRLEKPELETESLQQGVAPVVPSRSSKDSVEGNEATSPTRVDRAACETNASSKGKESPNVSASSYNKNEDISMVTMKAVRIHKYGGPEVLKYEAP